MAADHEPAELSQLVTEQPRADLADLDLRPVPEVVRLMVAEEQRVVAALEAAEADIAAVVEVIVDRLGRGGRLVYVGAGTAGRMGVLDAVECGPTFNTDRVVAVVAGGDGANAVAREGAEDDREEAVRALGALELEPRDVVVGVAASGRTPFTLAAVEAARAAGCATVAVVSNPGTPLATAAAHVVEIVTGPELVAGSTRLKAGSAQKAVLNTFSTAAMIRLGKTFGNLMVDVRTSNDKLRDRARRIVVDASGVSSEQAAAALDASGQDVKVAIVMLLARVDVPAARARLERSGGRVRDALDDPAAAAGRP